MTRLDFCVDCGRSYPVPGAVGERPDFERTQLEGLKEAKRLHAEGHFDIGGAVGEREELDVERLAEAMVRATRGDEVDVTLYDREVAESVATHYARLSVNEGGVAPVARTEAETHE